MAADACLNRRPSGPVTLYTTYSGRNYQYNREELRHEADCLPCQKTVSSKIPIQYAMPETIIAPPQCCRSITPPNGHFSRRLLLRHLSLLTRLAALCSPPYIATPAHQPLGGARRCQSWADIEVEDGFTSRLGLPGVVVDDVADLLLLAVDVARDVPVVTIKGWFGPVK